MTFPVSAQDWVTREACDVPNIEINDPDLTPAYLAAQEAEFENGIGRLWRVTSQSGAVSHVCGPRCTHPTRK